MKFVSLYCAIAALSIIVSGCATTRQTRAVETSGFLGDYSMLQKGEDGRAQLVYFKPGLDIASYRKMMIDPITVMLVADSVASKLPPEEIQRLADVLHTALNDELSRDYQIVSQPGPGVLRLRGAITEARGSKVVMDVITTIIPQSRLIATASGMAADTNVFVGKAGVEAEILDAQSGERLMAAVDERVGAKALRGSTGKWNDVEDAYRFWADRVRARLAELREPASAQPVQ